MATTDVPALPWALVDWFAGMIRPATELYACCSICGSAEHTRGQICPTVLADRQARNVCWHCGEEYLGTVNTQDVRESDGSLQTYYSWEHANGVTCTMATGLTADPGSSFNPSPARCAVCRREYTRTYASDGVYIWDHADGTSCRQPAPNHLQYWARELDRPIETRSIEEQQRARDRQTQEERQYEAERERRFGQRGDRERRIAADRESARRVNAQVWAYEGRLEGPERSLAGPEWGTITINTSGAEPPQPKKLPIAKPMKRVFNFASD